MTRADVTRSLAEMQRAMLTLGITGDSLFAGIREDLERGLIREARARLNFVDTLVNSNTTGQLPAAQKGNR